MYVLVCSICKQIFESNVVTVSQKTRKNKVGRIAWGRDCICAKCLKEK